MLEKVLFDVNVLFVEASLTLAVPFKITAALSCFLLNLEKLTSTFISSPFLLCKSETHGKKASLRYCTPQNNFTLKI